MKKVFRPFWSYDIEKTEQWLLSMAAQGYHFEKVNLWTRQFTFSVGQPKPIHYRIGYDKGFYSLSSVLVKEGWKLVAKHRQWYFIANESPVEEISSSPVREGVINHNRKVMYVFGGILIYMIISSMLPLAFTLLALFTNGTIVVDRSPMWIVTILAALILWGLPLYSVIKITNTNRRLERKTSRLSNYRPLRGMEEEHLKKSKEVVVKRKIGWMYSPDKLENWLEAMEQKGYNLSRVNRLGTTFYFLKGTPRNVSYTADYQRNVNQSYYEMHQEAGWRIRFTSKTAHNKWSLWSMVYEEDEDKPELYSDQDNMVSHARRVAIKYVAIYIPIIILYLALIALQISDAKRDDWDRQNWITVILSAVIIIEFGFFTIKSMLYYIRVKRIW